jgi:hypothetical protein
MEYDFSSPDRFRHGMFVPNVPFDKPDLGERLQVGTVPGRQIVQDRYFMAITQELLHQIGTDKTGATCNDNLHLVFLSRFLRDENQYKII